MQPILSLKSVSKSFEEKIVIDDVSLDLKALENLAIIGETGSSKTTLLKSMAGLLELDKGEVLFRSEKVKGPSSRLVPGHPQIKYLAQHFELPKFIKVYDYLNRSSEVMVENPDEIYEACNITHLLARQTMELSGGERQRVALAKEILKAPSVLLLDEPFSNLDFSHRQELHAVLKVIKKDLDVTTVLVAHDPKDVLAWADLILIMRNGAVIQKGSPKAIYNKPLDNYVAGLLGVYSEVSTADLQIAVHTKSVHQVIIRPHHVHLGVSEGMKGVVSEILYFGSYDQLTISFENKKLYAFSMVGSYHVGDEVTFEIKY